MHPVLSERCGSCAVCPTRGVLFRSLPASDLSQLSRRVPVYLCHCVCPRAIILLESNLGMAELEGLLSQLGDRTQVRQR